MALLDLLKMMGMNEAEAAQAPMPVADFMANLYKPQASSNLTAPENLRSTPPKKVQADPISNKADSLKNRMAKKKKELETAPVLKQAPMSATSSFDNTPVKIEEPEFADDLRAALNMLNPAKGEKQSFKGTYSTTLQPEQSVQMAINARAAAKAMGLDNFSDSAGKNSAESILQGFKDQIKKIETSYASPTMAYGLGAILSKNPVLEKLATQQYETADEKVLSMKDKFSSALSKISDMYSKVDQDKIDLYKAQKLPPTTIAAAEENKYPSAGRSGTAQSRMAENDLIKAFDSISTKAMQDMNNFNSMMEAFNSRKYNQVVSNLGPFARAISDERGVLTDTDITRNLPKNIFGTVAQIEAYFSKTPEGNVPKEYADGLKKLVQRAAKLNAKEYKNAIEKRKDTYRASTTHGRFMADGSVGDIAAKGAEAAAKELDSLDASAQGPSAWLAKKRAGGKK